MKLTSVHSKLTQHRTSASLSCPIPGSRGIALAPPTYGIDFVDQPQLVAPGNVAAVVTIQRQVDSDSGVPEKQSENRTGLPDHLKAGIETLSGLSLDDVHVHYNSTKPAAVQALAYTQGADIHVAPGQEQHLPHETWHVVQQKQGRVKPTFQLKGEQVNDDEGLEHEAEVMGGKALQMKHFDQVVRWNATPQRLTARFPSAPLPRTGVPPIQRTLKFPIPQNIFQGVQQDVEGYIQQVNALLHLQHDPKITFHLKPWFGEPRIEVAYSAQELLDQYPNFLDYLNLRGNVVNKDQLFELAGHKSGMPQALIEKYGEGSDKKASARNEEAHAALLIRARQVTNQFDYSDVDVEEGVWGRTFVHDYANLLNNSLDDTQGILQVLQHEEGVIIGEGHNDDANRALLVQLLPQLVNAGVTTIYLEAIRVDYQHHVDQYLNGLPNAPMSPELYRFLQTKGAQGTSYLQLLQAIKQQGGLRVKGIDSLAATSRPYGGQVIDRDMAREAAMNQFAAETIRADAQQRGQGKYVVLAGRAHSHTQPYRENTLDFNAGIPGLSQLLNIPATHVTQGTTRPVLDVENKEHRYRLG